MGQLHSSIFCDSFSFLNFTSLRTTHEVCSLSPTRSKFQGTPTFPFTPSSHGCEGVNGKVGGAVRAAADTGWARAKGRDIPDDGRSNPPGIRPWNRPDNAPDPGACSGAYFRANSRAISSSQRAVPQSIAGAVFQASKAWRRVRSFTGISGLPRRFFRSLKRGVHLAAELRELRGRSLRHRTLDRLVQRGQASSSSRLQESEGVPSRSLTRGLISGQHYTRAVGTSPGRTQQRSQPRWTRAITGSGQCRTRRTHATAAFAASASGSFRMTVPLLQLSSKPAGARKHSRAPRCSVSALPTGNMHVGSAPHVSALKGQQTTTVNLAESLYNQHPDRRFGITT